MKVPYLGFSEEELQVSTTEDAVVFDVAGNVHCAGSVHGAMDLHVVVDCVQVFLSVLEQTGRQFLSTHYSLLWEVLKQRSSRHALNWSQNATLVLF